MGLSTQWYKVIWGSQCFLIQNQKVGLKDVNAEFAKFKLNKWGLYLRIKNLVFSEKKLKYHYCHMFITYI